MVVFGMRCIDLNNNTLKPLGTQILGILLQRKI